MSDKTYEHHPGVYVDWRYWDPLVCTIFVNRLLDPYGYTSPTTGLSPSALSAELIAVVMNRGNLASEIIYVAAFALHFLKTRKMVIKPEESADTLFLAALIAYFWGKSGRWPCFGTPQWLDEFLPGWKPYMYPAVKEKAADMDRCLQEQGFTTDHGFEDFVRWARAAFAETWGGPNYPEIPNHFPVPPPPLEPDSNSKRKNA